MVNGDSRIISRTSLSCIPEDVGGAFGMGAVGGAGAAFRYFEGIHNSPNGEPLIGVSQAVCMMHLVLVQIAVWGGLFSAFDCTMVYVRQKEDTWNSIIAPVRQLEAFCRCIRD